MDVLAELTGMYLQRVTDVTVREPAAGNWGMLIPKPCKSNFAPTNSAETTSKKHN